MRTIKLTHEQHRIWRTNAAPTAEGALGARDALKKELLERTGGQTFRLMSPMARFLGTVRGENSSPAGTLGNQSGVPAPDSCICKAFAGTRPGEHHDVCQHRAAWNAWVAQQGAAAANLNPAMTVVSQKVAPPIDTQPQVKHMQVPLQVSPHAPHIRTGDAPVNSSAAMSVGKPTAVVMPSLALIPPDQCECKQFTKPSDADPKQHHFICQHYDKWKTAHPTVVATEDTTTQAADTEKPPPPDEHYALVDLDTRAVLRDATAEEVGSARAEEDKTGSPIITVDEVVYGVVPVPAKENAVSP